MNQPIVNKVSGERPLYDQVYQALLQQIVEGSYQIHQQLPSEKELSELFNVSRITIRQAHLINFSSNIWFTRFKAKALS